MNDDIEVERIPQREVARLVGVSSATVRRWAAARMHGFPLGVPLPAVGMVFRKGEVLAWIREREARVREVEASRAREHDATS